MHVRWRYAAAEGATRRGGKGEGRRPRDSQGELKGISGSVAARGIGTRGADDGRLRRRQSPASKRGKHNETTRIRFKGVGASPGFKESVSGVGWGGEALRRAGDEQRPPGADGNGGEAMPGDGGAREWFGEVLGSSRTVVAQGIGEGAHGGAQSGAAAAKQSNGGAARLGGRASNRTARGLSKMMQMARIWARSSPVCGNGIGGDLGMERGGRPMAARDRAAAHGG